MKLNSVSGLVYKVKDPERTADFYENLGFLISKRETDYTSVRVNWFWVDFIQAASHQNTGGDGQFLYVSVTDVDTVYQELKDKKLNPTEPETFKGTSRRETMISDPDGYKLVFFQKSQ